MGGFRGIAIFWTILLELLLGKPLHLIYFLN